MSLRDVTATLKEAPVLLQIAKEIRPRPLSTCDSFAARMEGITKRFPHHTAVIFEGKTRTWSELNEQSNRYTAALRGRGLKKGDTASLMMENRIEYLATLLALNKLGVTAALINTNLTGRSLLHCIKITNSKVCIFGEERLDAIADITSDTKLE
jgi:citronellyl-CoA synthetase